MADSSRDIDILLIGKTGNGKSATGNSILMRQAFSSNANVESVTKTVQVEFSEFEGRRIKVVDLPGIGDTSLNNQKGVKLVSDAAKKAVTVSPEGYHAILLIAVYGKRFTQEEVDSIKLLKKIFGDHFITYHSILLFTHGKDFEFDNEEKQEPFEAWCARQTGEFQELFQACGQRVMLFENKLRKKEKQEMQVRQLFDKADALSSNGIRYSATIFDNARDARDRVLQDPGTALISEEILKELGILSVELGRIDLSDPTGQLPRLEKLLERVDALEKQVQSECKGVNALGVALKHIQDVRQPFLDQKQVIIHAIEKNKRMKELEELERQKSEEAKAMKERVVAMQKEAEEREREYRKKIEENQQAYKQLLENQTRQATAAAPRDDSCIIF